MLALVIFMLLTTYSVPVFGMQPLDCVVQPTLRLEAGVSNVTNLINLPMGRQCEATLYFSDPTFLPMTFSFDASQCEQRQVNTFQVPDFSPNGEADVIWRCSNMATSCNHAEVFGGVFNSTESRHMSGDVGCLSEVIETLTTQVTQTASGTAVTTVTSVITVPTTVYLTSTSELRKETHTIRLSTKSATTKRDTDAKLDTQSTDLCPGSVTCNPGPTPLAVDLSAEGSDTPAFMTTPQPTENGPSAGTEVSRPADDSVFVNTSLKSMIPAVTVSIFTTITATVTQTL